MNDRQPYIADLQAKLREWKGELDELEARAAGNKMQDAVANEKRRLLGGLR